MDNAAQSVKPDEIDKVAPSKYDKYQQSGPQETDPDYLAIKKKDVSVDQNSSFLV